MGFIEGGFGIRVSDHDGVRSLELAGELDLARVGELRVVLGECRGLDGVVVDTTALTFINSTGLSTIVGACVEGGGSDRFGLVAGPLVERLLDVMQLWDVVQPFLREPLTIETAGRFPAPVVTAQRYFIAEPAVGERVSQFIEEAVVDLGGPAEVALVGSELAAALWRAGQDGFTVRLGSKRGHLRLEVLSTGISGAPAPHDDRLSEVPLRVIEVLSDHWGLELSDQGHSIWVEFGAGLENPDEDSLVAGVPI